MKDKDLILWVTLLIFSLLALLLIIVYKSADNKYKDILDKIDAMNGKVSLHIPIKSNEKITHGKLDMFCLSKNIFYEAATESYIGKLAVAQVTINRLKSGTWGNTICDVVYHRGQFSWTYDQGKRWTKPPKGELWVESQRVAEEVLKKSIRLRGMEDVYYYHADYVKPRWAHERYRVVKIGAHIFYTGAL
jgi:spore germination cell wall hydrolase CwlJ-like protein